MKKIGFSHGVLYKLIDIYSAAALDIYKTYSKDVLEFCLIKKQEIHKTKEIIPFAKDIARKSIHMPADVVYRNDTETIKLLDEIASYYKNLNAELILVHPDLVEDWTVFDAYPLNWAIENMDNLKSAYKSVEEIEDFFTKRNNWKFVLDLNHCYTNDKTMKLADDFIARLGSRLVEVHLSGYAGYHEPLFQTKQDIILEYCKKLEVPIVIESAFDDINDIGKEFEYISKYLNAA
ncbi:MAG: hypothetical protein WC608_05845 [Parcubacteria group bacterium]